MRVTGKQLKKARELLGLYFKDVLPVIKMSGSTLSRLERDLPCKEISYLRAVNFYEKRGIVFTEDGGTTLANTGS